MQPANPTVMSISLDDLNPFSGDGIFAGGAGDRGRSASNAKKAVAEWEALQKQYQQDDRWDPVSGQWISNMTPGSMQVTSDPLDQNPYAQHTFQEGPRQQARTSRYLDPAHAASLGLRGASAADGDGGSHWATANSAFDSMGPSSWDSYGSEFANLGPSSYEGMGPSSYSDLSYDAGALADMQAGGDYFQSLSSTGNDPIAEADFQRRTAAAESSRRANTDAALAQLEQRGQGNANAGLLADLSNQQASVSDQYLAGLDANAMAAQRRDFAARQGAEIAQMRGSGLLDAAGQRAAGLDAYENNRASGMDIYNTTRASGMDRAREAQLAGQDLYANNMATGQDRFASDKATGQDDFVQEKQRLLDDWTNNRYSDYYDNSQFNAGQYQHVDDRNYDRTWNTQDKNTDLWNNAATYNTAVRPGILFDQGAAITGGKANAHMGVATTYGNNAKGSQGNLEAWMDNGRKGTQAAAYPGSPQGQGG